MNRDQLTEIGTIKRAHGLKGELKIAVHSFYFEDIQAIDALFIKKGDTFLPFFIEEFQPQASQTIVKFESLNSKEEATELNGKSLFALTEHLTEVQKDIQQELTGKMILDAEGKSVGKIVDVDEMPTQLLLKVLYNNQEILLPYHESMFIKETESSLQFNIPEGLLDLS